MSEDGPRPGGEQALATPTLDVEVLRHGGAWSDTDVGDAMLKLAAHAALAAGTAAEHASHGTNGRYELTILLTDDAEIRDLNRTWRQKDQPTNVLSFPAADGSAEAAPLDAATLHGGGTPLGDIVIAFETTLAEANDRNISLTDHVSHLVVHGTLHVLGFDHLNDADAEEMEDLERRALATLGITDPYADDTLARDGKEGLAEIA